VISDLELQGCQGIGVASRDKHTVLIVTDIKTQFRTTRLPLQLRHQVLETVAALDKLHAFRRNMEFSFDLGGLFLIANDSKFGKRVIQLPKINLLLFNFALLLWWFSGLNRIFALQ
jgi:hypothetical protein